MTKTFKVVATVFAAIELFTCYYLWFDQDASKVGESTMAPANFKGWQLAQRSGPKFEPVMRQIEFFSLWVGNNKFIFSVLLLVCAYSKDGSTRLWASFFTSIGCALYFVTMDDAMRRIAEAGDVRYEQADEMASVVGFLLVLWLCTFAAEAHNWYTKCYKKLRSEAKAKAL